MSKPKDVTRLMLPNFDTFKSTRKDTSPYELFHFWVAAQIGGTPKGPINVSASCLHPKDAARLDSRASTWIKRTHKEHGPQWIKSALNFHRGDFSPANWQEGKVPKGVEPGYVYVDLNNLFGE